MKKAFKKHKNTHVTFMYIPESDSSVKTLRIFSWLPKLMFVTTGVLLVSAVISILMLNSMKIQYRKSKNDILKLTTINNTQKLELEKLTQSAIELQKQLDENTKALAEVKKAVGIKDTTDTNSNNQNESSNKINSIAPITQYNTLVENATYEDMTNQISSIEHSLVSIKNEISEQKEIIDNSSSAIKQKIATLAVRPSIMPVGGRITAGFGYRKNPFTSRGTEFHGGIDISATYGSSVAATADGTVLFSGWYGGYGKAVIISHGNGITTLYGHNSKLLVSKGDKVKKGQTISKVGSTGRSTGAHLHYEVKINGKNVNPAKYF